MMQAWFMTWMGVLLLVVVVWAAWDKRPKG